MFFCIEKIDYISAEVLQYRDNAARRMSITTTTKLKSGLTSTVTGIYPGNSKNKSSERVNDGLFISPKFTAFNSIQYLNIPIIVLT